MNWLGARKDTTNQDFTVFLAVRLGIWSGTWILMTRSLFLMKMLSLRFPKAQCTFLPASMHTLVNLTVSGRWHSPLETIILTYLGLVCTGTYSVSFRTVNLTAALNDVTLPMNRILEPVWRPVNDLWLYSLKTLIGWSTNGETLL